MNRHFEGYVYHLFYFVKADMHLHEGPDQIHSGYYYEIKLERKEEEKSPARGGIRTHDLSVMRRALYRCATTAAMHQ